MLMKKGAEASLFLEDWQGLKVVMKQRLPKRYRIPQIDMKIRTYRTSHEAQILNSAKQVGVPTPLVFSVDVVESCIVMEFVDGAQVKQILKSFSDKERRNLCVSIGELIGLLHRSNIVHGDLTTSNMILTPNGKIVIVDFGLAEKTSNLESKGVDLHLMKRALQSTHFKYAKDAFESVIHGYSKVVGREEAGKVLKKIKEIEERGRYVDERGK